MINATKRATKRYINKLFSEQNASLERAENLIKQVYSTQLQINHDQLEVTRETNNIVKNTGTISLAENEIMTKIFSGLIMYLDPRDLTVVPHLAMDSIWEHDITAAWIKLLKPGSTVIDIGANFGYFGALAAQKNGQSSKTIFFEANPKLLPYIKKTLAANWLTDICFVENAAVADKQGTLEFDVSPYYLGNASLSHDLDDKSYKAYKIDVEKLEHVTVKSLSLDGYCKENKIKTVDLIKMDIEGFEDTAYKGMREIIKASPNVSLFIEFTKQSYKDPRKFYNEMLADFGNVYIINKDGSIRKPRDNKYDTVIGDDSSWSMPIFSKSKSLAKQ